MAVREVYNNRYLSDDESNKYSHWVMVLTFSASFKNLGVTVVQLGNKEDQQIPGCYIAVGQTDNNQKAYVIKKFICTFRPIVFHFKSLLVITRERRFVRQFLL